MAGQGESNSYEEYKKYLELSIGQPDFHRPPSIMTPFQWFRFERLAERKARGTVSHWPPKPSIEAEWHSLPQAKREYYVNIHEVRKKQLNQLKYNYNIISNKYKWHSAYICYFQEQYPIIFQSMSNEQLSTITKIIANNWKNLHQFTKQQYNKQSLNLKFNQSQNQQSKEMLIRNYQEKIKLFKIKLIEDKQHILRKYGLLNDKHTKQNQVTNTPKIVMKCQDQQIEFITINKINIAKQKPKEKKKSQPKNPHWENLTSSPNLRKKRNTHSNRQTLKQPQSEADESPQQPNQPNERVHSVPTLHKSHKQDSHDEAVEDQRKRQVIRKLIIKHEEQFKKQIKQKSSQCPINGSKKVSQHRPVKCHTEDKNGCLVKFESMD